MQHKNTNYTVGDYLIKIKNAAMARNRMVESRCTNLVKAVAGSMKEMGYLEKIEVKKGVIISTLVFKNRMPVLLDLKIVSKPGLRVYMSSDDLNKRRKPSYLILSTSKGVMSSIQAVKKGVGGEVIAEIL
jgi:small subunit ribosomal protein S8